MTHGLDKATAMAYAAGTLPEAFDLVVATHMSMNHDSRADVEAFEAIGGSLLSDQDPAELSPTALDECLCRIDGNSAVTRKAESGNYVFPKPLRDMVGGDLDAVKWRAIGGGVKQAILKTEGDASVRLLSIPGGAKMPEHGHHGLEMTLVLKGAFIDEGERFGRGDIEIATEDLDHQPIAEEGETCICLAACEAPLKFNSFLPRVLQPLFRI